jgi:hypothetical protein
VPFTCPSHIAAVLPLLRRRSPLHATSLVVGAMIPDLAYIFGLSGSQTHSPQGVLICLPLGLAFAAWLQRLVLPTLLRVTPAMAGIDWPALLAAGSRSPLTLRDGRVLAWSGLSCVVGLGTHLLWDGLTHPGWWPARALYPAGATLSLLGVVVRLELVLWWGSTFLGAAAVVVWLRRRYPGPALPAGARRRWSWLLLVAAASAVLAALVWANATGGTGRLWWTSVIMARAGVPLVTLLCVLYRAAAALRSSAP